MPSDLDEAPSEPYLRELAEHILGSAWSVQRAQDQLFLELIRDEHVIFTDDTNAPERKRKFTPHRMGTSEAGRVVELLVSRYTPTASIGLKAVTEGVKGDAARDTAEIAIQEALDQTNPSEDPPRDARNWQIVSLGRASELGIMAGSAWWHDFPIQGDGEEEEPFSKRLRQWQLSRSQTGLARISLPVESTFPASWGRIRDEVLAVKEMSWFEMRDIFSEKELAGVLPKEGDKARVDTTATLGIYSNRKYLVYVLLDIRQERSVGPITFVHSKVETKILRTFEHNMGRSVVRLISGASTGRHIQGQHWKSALFNVASLIQNADRLLTLAGTAVEMNTLPLMKRLRIKNTDDQVPQDESYLSGDIWDVWLDTNTGKFEDIAPIFQTNGAKDTLDIVFSLLDRIATISGAVEVLSGAQGPAGQPAWNLAASIDQAQSTVQPITDAIVRADISDAEMILASVEQLGEKITLFHKDGSEIALDPEKVRGFAPILKAEYQVHLPAAEIARLQTGMELMASAVQGNIPISPFWTMEKYMGIEQPWEMYKDWIEVKALMDPKVVSTLVAHRLELLGVDLADELGMTAAEAMERLEELPPEAQQVVQQRIGTQVNGPNQAGMPFNRQPGNQPAAF